MTPDAIDAAPRDHGPADAVEPGGQPQPPTRRRSLLRQVFARRAAWVGVGLLTVFVAVAMSAPVLAPFDPFAIGVPLQAPSGTNLLGTDSLGRDVLSIMMHGSRVSLVFAIGSATISLVAGVVIGGVPAYLGGRVDELFSRLVEVVIMIPRLFLIITAVAILGTSQALVMAIIGLTIWPANAKLMRAQVLSLKHRAFVEAATSAGRTRLRIFAEHIVPNGVGPVVAQATLQMASAVLIEAGLSFLGLSDPNTASWGQLLNDAQRYIDSAPWLVIVPGVALFGLLVSLHLLGDSLEHALNPRSRDGG